MALNIFEAKEFHAASLWGGKHASTSEHNRRLSWHQRKDVASCCDVTGNGVIDRSLMALSSPTELWESDWLSLHICCGYKHLRTIPAFSPDTNSFSTFIKKSSWIQRLSFYKTIDPYSLMSTYMNSSNFWTSDGLLSPPLQSIQPQETNHRKLAYL